MTEVQLFTDGGSRGNPGPAAIGVYAQLKTEAGEVPLPELTSNFYLGTSTNNEAEYEAFLKSAIAVAEYVKNHQVDFIRWRLDSKLVVEQLNKNWKIKEDRLRLKAQEIWQILNTLAVPYSIAHVPREQNKEADRLVNEALDAQGH